MKKLALINDLSGYGRCSLSVMLPVLAVMGVQAAPAPTALLSNHTMYSESYRVDLSEALAPYLAMWEKNGFCFDAAVSGYLGAAEQADCVHRFFQAQKTGRDVPARIIVDPVMADHGKPYRGMTEAHVRAMQLLCADADVITPNLTEACLLLGADYQDVCKAQAGKTPEQTAQGLLPLAEALAARFQATAVVTGVDCGETLYTLVASVCAVEKSAALATKRAGANRPGTGDLFTAIFAAAWLSHGDAVRAAKFAGDFVAKAIRHSDEMQVPVAEGVQFEDLLGALL